MEIYIKGVTEKLTNAITFVIIDNQKKMFFYNIYYLAEPALRYPCKLQASSYHYFASALISH